MQNGYFDKVAVDSVKDFQQKLVEFLSTRQEKLVTELRDKGAFDDSITGQLKTAVGQFAETYTA